MATVLIVEPWYGGSHRAWADSWMRHSRHDFELVSMPAQFWRWRMRGGAERLAESVTERLTNDPGIEVVVVSGLVDVAALVGLARRAIAHRPVVTYMHENQLLYPLAPNQRRDANLAFANWRSVLVADEVWWNSAFHQDAFMAAMADLLAGQPEPTPPRWFEEVVAVSRVLHPGVEAERIVRLRRPEPVVTDGHRRPLVLWNQRWDHDKNPRAVLGALVRIAHAGVEFSVALAGEDPGHDTVVGELVDQIGDRVVHRGWLDRDDYLDLLVESDVVVSAADHEFFGIAIVEAIAAGAVPVLPDRLSFPELIEPRWRPAALYPDGMLRNRLHDVLVDVATARSAIGGLRESMVRFDVAVSAEAHDVAVDRLLSASGASGDF